MLLCTPPVLPDLSSLSSPHLLRGLLCLLRHPDELYVQTAEVLCSDHVPDVLQFSLPRSGYRRAALPDNNYAYVELTTAHGGTFTSSSARLSSQSRYSTVDQ